MILDIHTHDELSQTLQRTTQTEIQESEDSDVIVHMVVQQ